MPGSRLAALLLGVLITTVSCTEQKLPPPLDVDLTAPDGTKLKATFFSAGKRGPGVLLLHQCGQGESRHNWDELAPRLAAAGIHVLTFDYRGHGESDGTRVERMSQSECDTQILQQWPGDVDTAFAYLLTRPGVERGTMGVGGSSCGGFLAIRLASRRNEIKTLVLMSTVILHHQDREFLRSANQLPILIAGADDADNPDLLELQYQLSQNPGTKLLHFQTGGHGVAMFKTHTDLPATIVDWYVQTLIRTPGSAPATGKFKPAPPEILEIIDAPGGAQRVSGQLAEARKKDPKASLFNPVLVNNLGYAHWHEGDFKGAIEIFKLNVQASPESPGMYDSLADAYLADGQSDLARKTVKKELQLLSSDTVDDEEMKKAIRGWAEEKLKQLGEKP